MILGWTIVYVMEFNLISKQIYFCYMKILFDFTNSVDPDEMLHHAAFHQCLH